MITMRGVGGELRVGYAVVARLQQWSLTNGVLDAPGSEVDEYVAKEPGERTLKLKVGNSVWTWRNVNVVALEPLSVRLDDCLPEKRLL